ncbi:peptidase S41 [Iodidimonas gelatinilytica]|uniref:Peptidase S41 n=1 Tax=Iodidimonas gelatinilytica TaxID=1236966 RepID=A0A5A7MNX3_9PROT|nr:S41 family peptidase [Iodidimonas gelatinilytica]GEQ97556.1 peptidase S41 [Iodidimonas gelatinilytica]GER01541.1 peptidase S41 [Iodidimonas gelatinilytica]
MRGYLLGAGVAVMAFVGSATSYAAGNNAETYRQLNLLMEVFERVRAEYVEEVEDKEVLEAAINGMLASLDPHSSYMGPDSFRAMQVQTRGEYGGLGLEVTQENGVVKVVSPIDDTPASRAGLKSGDYITQIDGKPVLGLTLNDAVEMMRGPVGAPLTITVVRPIEGEEDEIFDVDLVRDNITVAAVSHRIERDNVGYVRVRTFNDQTTRGVKEAVRDIEEQLGDSMVGLVLDLRSNPGGLLDQAIAVSDAFLEKGEVVSTRGRHARDTKRWHATPGDLINGKPVVVLVDAGSASASEIVAGALQDHRRATILGDDTFGKGTVQTIIPLGAESALRLTTARYYTPSGRSIQERGIEPDIEVHQPRILPNGRVLKPRREKDLIGHLRNEQLVDESESDVVDEIAAVIDPDADAAKDQAAPDPQRDAKATADAADSADAEAETEEDPGDYQLNYALDLLQGIRTVETQQQAAADIEN